MDLEDSEITRDELLEWLEFRVSKAFLKAVNNRLKELYLEIGNGATLDATSSSATQAQTAKLVGKIEGLQEVLDLDVVKE